MKRLLSILAAGIAIGILIAPEKGSVTRSRIRDFWLNLKDELENMVHSVEGKIEDAAEAIDSQLQDKIA